MGNVVRFQGAKRQSTIHALIETYLGELEAENRSPNTVKGYRADLIAFLTFHSNEQPVVSVDALRTYFQTFEGRSPATQARHRASLKSFFRWLVNQGILDANPMDKIGTVKIPDRQPRPLRESDVAKLLKGIADHRDRLLFTLIAETGLGVAAPC